MQQSMMEVTNLENKTGSLADALRGADIFVVVSLRYARAMSQKAETLRETAYAFCAGLYPANNAAPDWKEEKDGLKFSFGDYGEFTVDGVELDSVETHAADDENPHKFYRYSMKPKEEGTTNP